MWPIAGVVLDAAGNLYGTTAQGGGDRSCGTVYELMAPVGKGPHKEKVLNNFNYANGCYPGASLIFDSAGNLYGTTGSGGGGYGVAFELTP